jgi:hypothetical protein
MSFLDRLIHQLTRPRASQVYETNDEEFTEIEPSEIAAVTNDNIDPALDKENKLKTDTSFKNSILSFIEELNEETDVIRGSIDEKTLFNRRREKAKSIFPAIQDNQPLFSRTSL